MAAIYVLRLALGLKKHFSIPSLGEVFEINLGDLTGLIYIRIPGINCPKPDEFLTDPSPEPSCRIQKNTLLKHVRDRLKQLMDEGMALNVPLFNNLSWIAHEFGLSLAEQELLAVRLLMNRYPFVKSFINEHCCYDIDKRLLDYLRILTTRPIADIEKSLAPNGALRTLGWLELMRHAPDMEETLVLPPNLLEILLLEQEPVEKLLIIFFKVHKPSILRLSDYANLQNDLDIILPYLQAALDKRQKGVNLLIQGSSEQGKIELVKLVAQNLGAELFEVRRSATQGIKLAERDRFAGCKLTQHWLSKQTKPSLMVFADAAKRCFLAGQRRRPCLRKNRIISFR